VAISNEEKIRLIEQMGPWELCALSTLVVLPLRPEDATGLLISEVDFTRRRLRMGSRFGGRDFNKGKCDFVMPFPEELVPIFRFAIGQRAAGPLLQSRRIWSGSRSKIAVTSSADIERQLDEALRACAPGDVLTSQDQKRVCRNLLRKMGGSSQDELATAFKSIAKAAGLSGKKLYDLRSSCTTQLERSGLSHLAMRYLTGHTTADILNAYVSLDPDAEMQKYFQQIGPLLAAMATQAQQLITAAAQGVES
jgi:integrase